MTDVDYQFRKLHGRLDDLERLVKKAIRAAEEAKKEAQRAQS